MANWFGIGMFAFVFPWGLWYGYRAATTSILYQSLSDPTDDDTAELVDGESVRIEGQVSVAEPADASERAIEGADSSIGAYVWRAMIPRAGANRIDFTNWEVKQGKATFASGLESGTFTVSDGRQTVRVDPEWLVNTHGATKLSELTVGGVTSSRSFHTYLWDSPYFYLSSETPVHSLKRMQGVVNKHHADLDLDDYFFQTKPILDGQSLAVCGAVRIEQGDPILCGTDNTPLILSDQGFEGLRSHLKSRIMRQGLFSTILIGIALFAVVFVPPV